MFRFWTQWNLIWLGVCVIAVAGPALPLEGQALPGETVAAWNEYVQLTEERIAGELGSEDAFLVQDFDADAHEMRADLLEGDVIVETMKTVRHDGSNIKVPHGMIHHWQGAVFVGGVTLEEVLSDLKHPDSARHQQEDVLETRVLERGPDSLRVYLRLVRSKIITVTYDTEHLVQYVHHRADRASSRTVATHVAELADAGTAKERQKAPGEDRGFLWRLNSYWRYEAVEGGVIIECESLTLSRSIPLLVVPFVKPIVNRVARESLDRTLSQMRGRMTATP